MAARLMGEPLAASSTLPRTSPLPAAGGCPEADRVGLCAEASVVLPARPRPMSATEMRRTGILLEGRRRRHQAVHVRLRNTPPNTVGGLGGFRPPLARPPALPSVRHPVALCSRVVDHRSHPDARSILGDVR